MARKKHGAEQIVAILRQIEVELANHKNIGQACKEAGITQQTYYRWRKEYGGLKAVETLQVRGVASTPIKTKPGGLLSCFRDPDGCPGSASPFGLYIHWQQEPGRITLRKQDLTTR